ncbi:DUF452 family protein [bacterium]|nr:DUF452 family protein [bacterium]
MKYFLKNNNSSNLIIFFAGWGCDETEFSHMKSKSDILICYDYVDLELTFDFSKYKEKNLMAFSAGGFVASVMNFDFEINKSVIISSNPLLFDEYFGLSGQMIEIFKNITEENCEDFRRKYLVATDKEFDAFIPPNRTLESCNFELDCLKKLYEQHKNQIKPIFDCAIIGSNDKIFNVEHQKEYYKEKLYIVEGLAHNMFYTFSNFEDFFEIADL